MSQQQKGSALPSLEEADDELEDSSGSHRQAAKTFVPRIVGESNPITWLNRKESKIVVPGRRNLPAGPSMICAGSDGNVKVREKVAIFNANTPEGNSIVRALAKSGCDVIALVRVFTSKYTKALVDIPHVTVKVADSHNQAELTKACAGVHRAFFCTKYWEWFDSSLEEKQATMIVNACAENSVHHLVFSSFEDTKNLKENNIKSQIKPDQHGIIFPKFKGMKLIKRMAKKRAVMLTHMLTSYIDQENSKMSLCLIVGENGSLILQPNLRE